MLAFQEILNAGLEDLFEINENRFVNLQNPQMDYVTDLHAGLLGRYAKITLSYLSSDQQSLFKETRDLDLEKPLYEGSACESLFTLIHFLSFLRMNIRNRTLNESELQGSLKEMKFPFFACPKTLFAYLGEFYFVLAMAFDVLENQTAAWKHFYSSYFFFQKSACKLKAARALHNAIACKSHVEPMSSHIHDYYRTFKLSSHAKDFAYAGLALLNISIELQRYRAYLAALKFVNRSVTILGREAGTLHHYLALTHRCQLMIELERFEEAKQDLQFLRLSEHLEIKAAVEILESERSPRFYEHLTSVWKKRMSGTFYLGPSSLSTLENRFLSLLLFSAKSKKRLIRALWGPRAHPESLELRFKRLNHRMREKIPGMIFYDQGLYHFCGKHETVDP